MIVDINEQVRVRFDSTCWSIEKCQQIEKGKEAGGVRWPSIGYYGSLSEALFAVMTKHIHLLTSKEHMVIQEVVDLVAQTRKDLLELAKKQTT
jgi:hypothetical protein